MASLPPLVFVHGLKGSHLREGSRESGARRYLSVWRLLCGACCKGVDQMPLPRRYEAKGSGGEEEGGRNEDGNDDDPPQARDTLIPDGPIADVRFAGVKVASMYTPLFDWAEARGRRLYAFSYDWRRSPFEAGQKLEAFLTDVLRRERESGVWTGKGAQLIVHSDGGIVACK